MERSEVARRGAVRCGAVLVVVLLEIQRQPLLFFIHMYEILITFLFPFPGAQHFKNVLLPTTS